MTASAEAAPPSARASAPPLRLAGALSCAALFVALAGRTWGRWPDVLVDFGRELYVPWRLTLGERLYADLAWFNGPLSAQWNALVFRVFGVGLASLVWTNLALLALAALAWHALLRRATDAFGAWIGTVLFLAVFAFGQYVGIGNYNWVTPYSHELTHGLLLGFLALACAARARAPWSAAAGLLLGLCFLTKPEVFLAAALGVATQLALGGRARLLPRLAALALGLALPLAVAYALLAASLGAADAGTALLGAWPQVLRSEVSRLPFYRAGMGTDRPLANLGALLVVLLAWLAVLVPAAVVELALRSVRGLRWALAGVLFVAAWVTLDVLAPAWLRIARPLPLALLLLGATAFWLRRRSRAPDAAATLARRVALVVFALALCAKMVLNTRVQHYGFALAMPAATLTAAALSSWIPELLRRYGATGTLYRAALCGALAALVAGHLRISERRYERKVVRVGYGPDTFLADGRAQLVNRLLERVERELPEDGTLLVLPEGVTVNYLARRRSPTPYVNFMPPELLMYGEDAIVAALAADPPDLVALVHKNTAEYGLPLFGTHYGRRVAEWIEQRYEPLEVWGQPPLQPDTRFGIALLGRR